MTARSIRVSGLYVYPLKSAGGISVDAMTLDDLGPQYDRRWMLIDEDGRFISQREKARLSLVATTLNDGALTVAAPDRAPFIVPPADASGPRIQATIWDDTVDAVSLGDEADAWFSDFLSTPCRLVFFPEDSVRLAERVFNPKGRQVGFADGFPLLVIGETSISDLNARIVARGSVALPMNRFRPNLVVDGADAYAEDGWREIRIGGDDGIRFSIVKPCARCSITTVDQSSGVRGKEPLATLATYRRGPDGSAMMGQNALHDAAGVIRIGDVVSVLSSVATELGFGAVAAASNSSVITSEARDLL